MTASASTRAAGAELSDAVDASRTAREAAERELRLSTVARARAAEALERTARRPGLDESERARLRAEYADADRVVAERQSAVDRAREFELAAAVVAGAFHADAAASGPLAAALLELAGTRGASRVRASLASTRRAAPAVRLRGTRPRTA